ncbi:hypothetical protein EDB81DRAFT_805083 [Dactylonectria macrodidyma]|uniref:Azaphilone pigments biosynthesis cluster protein L N-terminal domain-containing protein n=1 Tax=Dactylonectria macrodidyma TaxID=307937 RepID=A0A9P9IX07_9HYPO|nr:hypothetical protein EDB81DRAFT_805083 [Dactylonectria macrodidyma]
MEAIGAGANVLAFVVLGLKSARFVHDTLSAVHDGPQIVKQVARDILQLHYILERLSNSRAAANDAPLVSHAQQCVRDLGVLADTLQKLQPTRNEKTTGRLWKRFKTVLNEKQLAGISSQVIQHTTFLNVRIDILSSDAIFDIRDANKQFLQTTRAHNALIDERVDSLTHRFDKIEDAVTRATTDKESVEQRAEPLQKEQVATQPISVTDIAAMQTMLQEIRQHIIAAPNTPVLDTGLDKDGPQNRQNDAHEASHVEQQMLDSLDRLCGFVDEKQTAIDAYTDDDELAESIIEDLQQLVRTIKRHEAPVERIENGSYDDEELSAVSFQSGLRRFGRGFGNGKLSVNEGGNERPHYTPDTRIQQTRTFDSTDIGVGKLSLLFQKRKRSTPDSVEDDGTSQKRSRIDYKMSLTFLPNGSGNRHMLVASTFQHQTFGEGVFSLSTLMVNRVLPVGSLVFEVVKKGNLQKLQQMFRDGEASPRDHDEHGASLLHYSSRQPDVCKFLITCGLEVDHVAIVVAVDRCSTFNKPTCPLQVEVNDFDETDEELVTINQCRRLLLEAGADPTLNLAGGELHSFYEEAVFNGSTESIRMALNPEFVGHYGFIASPGMYYGRSPFLSCCEGMGNGIRSDSIQTFLAFGSNIHDRDNGGLTCLHIALENLRQSHAGLQDFYAIKCLIQSGANPRAVDNFGRSVSDVAYSYGGITKVCGSYRGDLWDAVLQSCGFDISQFRSRAHQRKARYTKRYRKVHFEALWEQREAECPYWDGMPWPPLEPGETEVEDDETSEEDDETSEEDDETSEEDDETSEEDDETNEDDATDEDEGTDSEVGESSVGHSKLESNGDSDNLWLFHQCKERYHCQQIAGEGDSEESGFESDGYEIPEKTPNWNEWSNEEEYARDYTGVEGETRYAMQQVPELDLDNPWTN